MINANHISIEIVSLKTAAHTPKEISFGVTLTFYTDLDYIILSLVTELNISLLDNRWKRRVSNRLVAVNPKARPHQRPAPPKFIPNAIHDPAPIPRTQ